jgi:DegV family protein with EDD domain
MTKYMIDGHKLYDFVASGAQNLIVNEHNLNRINVFPVADGDTGTNLALTMKNILSNAKKDASAQLTMNSIAKVALESAYGNSGMIFAQYLNGLAIEIGDKVSITQEEFALATQNAVKYAYEAVASPKEGTILTVMKEWSTQLMDNITGEFEHVFDTSITNARKVVDQTKFKLKVLLDNDVVDAGAKGFYYFIEGIGQFIKTGNLETLKFKAAQMEEFPEIHPDTNVGEFKYCSQFLVESTKDKNYFQKLLTPFGDSLVVTSKDDHVQVHLHAKSPELVMEALVKEGTVLSHKIDDMQLQANLKFQPKSKITIVTDSIADVSKDFLEQENIVVVPLNLIVDSTVYLDKLTMTPDLFYRHLDDYRMNPTSAQATIETIERIFNQVLQSADEIIGIFVSAKMSGTFNNIQRIVSRMNLEGKKVKLIDSKVNSVAQGLLVAQLAKWRNQGFTFDELVEKAEQAIANTHIYVSVKDLKYMLRGGRVSKVQGFILSKLDLKPVISIDPQGKGEIYKKTLSQKKAVSLILKKVKEDMDSKGISTYGLVYADDPNDITEFSKQVEQIIGKKPAYIEAISPIVGLNAGKGAFAIGYIKGAL